MTSNITTLFAERLRFIRKQNGLSQEKLAELAGIAPARISELESGNVNPTLETIQIVTNALGIQPIELFDFGRIRNNTDIAEKKKLIEILQYTLMDRDLEEVNYVVDFTNRFLNIIDKK